MFSSHVSLAQLRGVYVYQYSVLEGPCLGPNIVNAYINMAAPNIRYWLVSATHGARLARAGGERG